MKVLKEVISLKKDLKDLIGKINFYVERYTKYDLYSVSIRDVILESPSVMKRVVNIANEYDIPKRLSALGKNIDDISVIDD